jgi:hypothetical protein
MCPLTVGRGVPLRATCPAWIWPAAESRERGSVGSAARQFSQLSDKVARRPEGRAAVGGRPDAV